MGNPQLLSHLEVTDEISERILENVVERKLYMIIQYIQYNF